MAKIIILAAGLAGVGKTTYFKALAQTIPNSVYIDKDDVNAELGQSYDANSVYYKTVIAPKTYHIMLQRAHAYLAQGKTVLLDGYFGNKLTQSPIKELFTENEVMTSVVYFHCSAEKQQQRLLLRASPRDQDKEGEKFIPYRRKHLSEHVRDLARVPHLVIDTEKDTALEQNVEIINDYVKRDRTLGYQPCFKEINHEVTDEEVLQGATQFRLLLAQQEKNVRFTERQERMKYSYTQFESSLSFAMLEMALQTPEIRSVLTEIATRLRQDILPILVSQERSGLSPKLGSLAMQHASGDKFLGAILPDYTEDYLEHTEEGRQLLLTAVDNCLRDADKIKTPHEFLALMKVIDGMAYFYDVFETEKKNPVHLLCKDYIAPTEEEVSIRARRPEKLIATTYGTGTELGTDLVPNKGTSTMGCLSGKARFFISPPSHRARVWFEKLADQQSINKPALPLVASPSNTTAKSFIMAHGLGLFLQENGLFELNKAQMFANCLMAYLLFCGHHSFLEIVEIWNRQLDFLIIEHPEQLQKDTIPSVPTTLPYFEEPDAPERKLPYARVGDYASFLCSRYADAVIGRTQNYLTDGLDLNLDGAHSTVALA